MLHVETTTSIGFNNLMQMVSYMGPGSHPYSLTIFRGGRQEELRFDDTAEIPTFVENKLGVKVDFSS
jgi:hypothetical protein